jgi:hypothetical protein
LEKTLKVTGDTTASLILDISVIYTDDIISTNKKLSGIEEDNDNIDIFLMHTCIQSDPGEPKTWREALEGKEREWWLRATTLGFNNFLKRGAWKFVLLEVIRKSGRRLIPTKLLFKKEDEIYGAIRYKVRDVTLGFMMIPGVDFTERFSPVSTDEALRIQIGINLKKYILGWRTYTFDIEAAFLEPTMDNEMYIEPSCGMWISNRRTTKEVWYLVTKLDVWK